MNFKNGIILILHLCFSECFANVFLNRYIYDNHKTVTAITHYVYRHLMPEDNKTIAGKTNRSRLESQRALRDKYPTYSQKQ